MGSCYINTNSLRKRTLESSSHLYLPVFSFCVGNWVHICVQVYTHIYALGDHRSALGAVHLVL